MNPFSKKLSPIPFESHRQGWAIVFFLFIDTIIRVY